MVFLNPLNACADSSFQTVWIVATRGIRNTTHTTKQQILDFQITQFCDAIIDLIKRHPSTNNLKLSGILINGICRISQFHVNKLYNDTLNLLLKVNKKDAIRFPTIAAQRKHGKRDSFEAFDDEFVIKYLRADSPISIEQLEAALIRPSPNVVDVSRISLRDEIPHLVQEVDFGEIGSGIDILREPEIEHDPALLSFLSSEKEPPTKVLKLTKEYERQIKLVEEAFPQIITQPISSNGSTERHEIESMQIDVQPPQRIRSRARVRKVPSIVPPTKPYLITLKRNKTSYNLNLKFDGVAQNIFSLAKVCDIPKYIEDNLYITFTELFTITSPILRRAVTSKTPTLSPSIIIEQQRQPAEEIGGTPIRLQPDIDIVTSQTSPVAILPEQPIAEIPEIQEVREQFRPLTQPQQIRTKPSKAGHTEDDSSRLASILLTVRDWNYNQKKLEIDDISLKPINRFNAAVAFNDLLYLQKKEYVSIVQKVDSFEFDCIKIGRRLL